ncbi:MAG: S8 family serine peptidase, partial [Acidobacteriota bacterium]
MNIALGALLTVLLTLPAFGHTNKRFLGEFHADDGARISPVLRQQVASLLQQPSYDRPIPVIIRVNRDFFELNQAARRERGESLRNALSVINGYSARLTAAQIRLLLESELVEYVTLDAPLRLSGRKEEEEGTGETVSSPMIIGAHLAHDLGYKGSGITIALFDSGISDHPDFKRSRIRVTVDFTSGKPVFLDCTTTECDPYGHGTHIAGVIGGSGRRSYGLYSGVAPKAKYVDVRVVDETGTGRTSNLIAAIDWVIRNKDKYEIRLANLSLGHPPVESYTQDPLCQAVERMVEAGIVTVASAGNLGKTETHPQIWGAIVSPGNDPAVITVSAINTQGTLSHADDIATTYSSRGPTYLDNLFKPDLSAPGNAVVSTGRSDAWLAKHYPELQINKYYLQLSGSSVAAAHVSGAVALMLSANDDLTPRMVKAILMLTASKLRQPHMLEQGNGLVNAYTAVRLAEAVDVRNRSVLGTVEPYWSLDEEMIWAGGAFAFGDKVVYSALVDAGAQGEFWGSGVLWIDRLLRNTSVFWADSIFWSDSSIWPENSLRTNSIFWTDSIFWSDSVLWTDSIFWSDSVLSSNSVFWSDSVIRADGL